MKCGNCGSYIRDDSKFCNYCGVKLNGNTSETEQAPVPLHTDGGTEVLKASADTRGVENDSLKNRPRDEDFNVQPQKPKDEEVTEIRPEPLHGWVIFLIALAGVILAIIAVLFYNSMKNNQHTVITVGDAVSATLDEETIL